MTVRRKTKSLVSKDHEEALAESLRDDSELAAAYLDAVLQDGDQDEFLLALRRLSNARGGLPAVAARARLNPTTLYRTLSARGNPELKSMRALLRAMGLRLSVEPTTETNMKRSRGDAVRATLRVKQMDVYDAVRWARSETAASRKTRSATGRAERLGRGTTAAAKSTGRRS
jgi:probable addiction module antidote protein